MFPYIAKCPSREQNCLHWEPFMEFSIYLLSIYHLSLLPSFFLIMYLITLKIHSNYIIKGSTFIEITHDPTQFHLLSFVRFNSHWKRPCVMWRRIFEKVIKVKKFQSKLKKNLFISLTFIFYTQYFEFYVKSTKVTSKWTKL